MLNIETSTGVSENGAIVKKISFPPNGTTHDLQRKITELLDRIVRQAGMFTLAELGYLHINTLTYDKESGQIYLKIYFDANYTIRFEQSRVNTTRDFVPVQELAVFRNYLFVGNLKDVVTVETIMAPKHKNIINEFGHPSIQFKENSSKVEETHAAVLNCNLPITMAAMLDIPLDDPEFRVSCDTVGKGGKNAVKSIVTTSNNSEVPVAVTITCSQDCEDDAYDPNIAESYLIDLRERLMAANQNREKLKQSVRKTAKKNGKKRDKHNNAAFYKYS